MDLPSLRTFLERTMPLLEGQEPEGAETPSPHKDKLRMQPLAGDGSGRQFYRVDFRGARAVAMANSLAPERSHPDENEAFYNVRWHLAERGIRVPAIYAADLTQGLFLMEDLGDLHLADLERQEPAAMETRYREAVSMLVAMQAPRAPAFDPASSGNPTYTADFVLEHEAAYFHAELVVGQAGSPGSFDRIASECQRLADSAIGDSGATLIHRDFQSRNLMVAGPRLTVIDFQGARLGPPQYDLASLLWDPYAKLSHQFRQQLKDWYLEEAGRGVVPGVPGGAAPVRQVWQRQLLANAANRLMQALGAYAKLGGRLGRPGFWEHIPWALSALAGVLEERGDCPILLALIGELQAMDWEVRS